MNKVLIRRCPVCDAILARTQEVSTALKRIQGLEVEVVDGQKGEFAVLVDGRLAARNNAELPTAEEVVEAVQEHAFTRGSA